MLKNFRPSTVAEHIHLSTVNPAHARCVDEGTESVRNVSLVLAFAELIIWEPILGSLATLPGLTTHQYELEAEVMQDIGELHSAIATI